MTPDEFELAAAERAAEQAFDHLAGLMGLDGGSIKQHLADLLGAEADRLRDVAEGGDGGPVVVIHTDGHGCDGDYPGHAVFSHRYLAEAAISGYDAAVRRAIADGAHGVHHVGDLAIADREGLPLDPPSLRPTYQHDYLLRYWPEDGTG